MTPDLPSLPPSLPDEPTPARRSRWRHVAYTAAGVLVIGIVFLAALLWYATTPQFAARVHRTIVATLEHATGGKVDMGSFQWSARGLSADIDDLTIHGKEAPNEVPYFHVQHLTLHAKIISFFTPKIALASLTAERPTFHLILYPDGTTNQPQPRTAGKQPLPDSLLRLAIDSTRVQHGLVLLNDRAIPWEMASGPLRLDMQYVPLDAEYRAVLETKNLTFRLKNSSESRSKIVADIRLGRNSVRVNHLDVITGRSQLTASGELRNFSHPDWRASLHGSVNLRQVGAATGVNDLRNGTAQLDLHAQGEPGKIAATDFQISGHMDLKSAEWESSWLRLQNIELHTNLLVDNDQCSLTNFSSILPDQGRIAGNLVMKHCFGPSAPVVSSVSSRRESVAGKASLKSWLSRHEKFNPRDLLARLHRKHAPATTEKENAGGYQPLEASLQAHVSGVTLPFVLAAVAPRLYWNIGFTTATSGEVTAHWTGAGHDLDVHGDLTMRAPQRLMGLIPVSGSAHADYLGNHRHLVIQQADENTPATQVHASGLLTLFTHDLNSNLRLDVTGRDLGEFDQLLTILDLRETAKGQPHALPVKLLGSATFHGNVHGSFFALEAMGHLDSERFEMVAARAPSKGYAAAPVHLLTWDGFHGDVSYTPSELIVRNAELVRGHSIIHTALHLLPDRTAPDNYAFDKRTQITASMETTDASLVDLQSIVGKSYPASGELTANAHFSGVVDDINGGGRAALTHAIIAGQEIRAASIQIAAHGHTLEATHLQLAAAGGSAVGKFTYDYESGALTGEMTGRHFALNQIAALKTPRLPMDGSLGFHVQAAGTAAAPLATGTMQVENLTLDDQSMGTLHAEAHLQRGVLLLTSGADLLHAHVRAAGQVELHGDDPAQAQLTFTGFNADPLLRTMVSTAIDGASPLDGRITMSGPLRRLSAIQADATLNPFTMTIRHRTVHSDGPVEVSLRDGKMQLKPIHIQGQDVNLAARGTIDLINNYRLRLHSEGVIQVALASAIAPPIESSGQIRFVVNAGGTVRQPDLRGRAQVNHVNVHLPNITNGLTDLNGELLFDQDRMVIQQLTGSSGGGGLQMKGFIGYRNGVFVDLTTTVHNVRIRYPKGVSSSADAKLRLLGSYDNLLLSGNVTMTRFGIGSSVDLAALAGGGGVSAPIDPASPLNRVRLDVHVTSTPALGFQNSFASLAGEVNLRIRGTLENPSVLGRIDITEGSASFAGTKYHLQQGDIVFNNPVTISPEINLQASARVQNYDIIISLHGPPSKLDISYRSEPPLTQADVLALLALGRTNEQATQYGEVQQQAGANLTSEALLGGALNAAVSSRVQKLFGVGSVRVDPNFVGTLGESTARITVEEQVGTRATLTFATNVNTTAQQLIQAQYDLTRNVSVIAVRDEANVFSMYLQIRARHK